jgi:hypothetical protein
MVHDGKSLAQKRKGARLGIGYVLGGVHIFLVYHLLSKTRHRKFIVSV